MDEAEEDIAVVENLPPHDVRLKTLMDSLQAQLDEAGNNDMISIAELEMAILKNCYYHYM